MEKQIKSIIATDENGVWFEGIVNGNEFKSGYARLEYFDSNELMMGFYWVKWPGTDEDDCVCVDDYGKTWNWYRNRPDDA